MYLLEDKTWKVEPVTASVSGTHLTPQSYDYEETTLGYYDSYTKNASFTCLEPGYDGIKYTKIMAEYYMESSQVAHGFEDFLDSSSDGKFIYKMRAPLTYPSNNTFLSITCEEVAEGGQYIQVRPPSLSIPAGQSPIGGHPPKNDLDTISVTGE